MRKKLTIFVLLTAMISSVLLAGCGKKEPTAEELLKTAWGSEPVDSVNMNVKFIVDADIDAGSILGDESSESTMNTRMSIDLGLTTNYKDSYLEGNIDATMFGFSFSEPIKSYITLIDDKNYIFSFDTTDSCWYREESTEEGNVLRSFDKDSITAIDYSIFDSYELKKINKEDTTYTVTGTISYSKLMDKVDVEISDLLNNFNTVQDEEIDLSDIKLDTTMVFDRETRLCKQVDFIFDMSDSSQEGVTYNELSMSIVVSQINGVEVEVPQDVIDSAKNREDSIDTEFSFSPDDDKDTVGDTDKLESTQSYDSTQTLAKYMLNVDYAYQEDVLDLLSIYYDTLPDNDTISSFTSLINSYNVDEFIEYLGTYSYWTDSYKNALAIMVDTGMFDIDDLTKYGVDGEELQSLVDSLNK